MLRTLVCAPPMVLGHFWKNAFLTHFSPILGPKTAPFHIGIFHGPKRVISGSKWPKRTSVSIQVGPGSLLEKRVFDPFFTRFGSQNGPFSRHFGIFRGPKRVTTGSKWAKTTCLIIPYGPGSHFGKTRFSPIFDAFLVPKRPIFKAFWDFSWPKTRHHGLKTGLKTLV